MRPRDKRNRSRGASAVEMAIVTPLIVTLIMAQIESSRLGMVAQLITTAAREGCRVAVVPGATQSAVQTRVKSILTSGGISTNAATLTCPSDSTLSSASQGTAITVSLSVPYSQVSWLGTPYFLSTATISASATMSSENP